MTKILLVDDSATDLHLYTSILQQDPDYEVHSCGDGKAALASIAENAPDVVLTDMQMPIMDGLELVTHMRRRFPEIPVILLTGQGSEEIATKALRAGAAGYIAKSQSHDALTETVRHVLWLSHQNETDSRINDCTTMVHYELKLRNDEELLPGLLSLTRQRLTEHTKSDSATLLQCETALEQAVLNSIYHGNLDFKQFGDIEFDADSRIREAKRLSALPPYRDRFVYVGIRITPEEVRFAVRDEGDGFDVKEVSSLGLTQSLRGKSGRGLFLMWAFMDKVLFDKTGNSVTLAKQLNSKIAKEESKQKEEPAKPLTILRSRSGQDAIPIPARRITLGRAPSCDIVVDADGVSQHHCVLFVHEGWWFVRDLNSTNGIRVDGKPCLKHILRPHVTLNVGSASYQLDYRPMDLGAVGITPPTDPF